VYDKVCAAVALHVPQRFDLPGSLFLCRVLITCKWKALEAGTSVRCEFCYLFLLQVLRAAGVDAFCMTFAEPKRVPFVVSDTENGCESDINFAFTGFSLSGAVVGSASTLTQCAAAGHGPAGVTVELHNATHLMASTTSEAGTHRLLC
jgi:hypothetical protein